MKNIFSQYFNRASASTYITDHYYLQDILISHCFTDQFLAHYFIDNCFTYCYHLKDFLIRHYYILFDSCLPIVKEHFSNTLFWILMPISS